MSKTAQKTFDKLMDVWYNMEKPTFPVVVSAKEAHGP